MPTRGAFIVIDGTDGSGKATQTHLLVTRLKRDGVPVETISFPQYGTKSAGLVEEYLAGKYGSAQEVGAYRASIFYAADRYDASQKIRGWLDHGSVVIADRYVGSNMGHQGAKISDPRERTRFFDWNADMEYNLFGIPQPDVNVVLHVPALIAQRLAQKNTSKHGLAQDIHEKDLDHLKAAEQAYLDLTIQFKTFQLIECVEGGTLLSPTDIHERVWMLVRPLVARLCQT
jgi:dTMP kinase